jgi:hypothetical protein
MSKRRGKKGATRVMMRVQKEEQVCQPSSKLFGFMEDVIHTLWN